MVKNQLVFAPLDGFEMTVRYVEDHLGGGELPIGHHVHAECEIYVNLGGDVSFMVEDQLYPIRYGNIVITRPYEYHHCIYHKKMPHPHFWILFSGSQNQRILDLFFGRQKGRNNLFSLGKEQTQELIGLCHTLCETPHSEIDKYFCFFKMLRLLEDAKEVSGEGERDGNDVATVLHAIHQNYAARLSVRELAEEAHISVSTLERWFAENLRMTPSVYIKKIRLANAARFLSNGYSVTETAEQCGFSDVSAMISLFKQQYGMTPLQYKKKTEKGETV